MTNEAKRLFVQERSVYHYQRPRKNLLASCVWICNCTTCWQNESLPS